MMRAMSMGSVVFALGMSLSLCVACGGSSADGNAANGGASGGPSGGAGRGGANGSSGAPGSAGGLSTNVPGDTPLNELSDSELEQLCKDFTASYGPGSALETSSKEFSCRFSGLLTGALSGAKTDAELRTACKATYDACLKAPNEAADPETCDKPDSSCTATVAEVKACAQDSVAALDELKDAIPTCAEATLESLQNLDIPTEEDASPASCTALQAKCPDAPTPPGPGDNDQP